MYIYLGYVCTDDDDGNNIRRTIHDYIGPLAFMPNEPKYDI